MLTLLLTCLPVLAAPRTDDAPAPAVLTDVYPFSDPSAAAVSADETLAFVAEGAAVTILDLTEDEPSVLRRIPVDASILGLVPVGERLFVCGGSLGLLAIDLRHVAAGAKPIDDVGEAVCTDAVRIGDALAVTFALEEGSQLRTYDLATLGLLHVVALPAGRAHAVATDGEFAWVALGTGGLVRVDLGASPRPRLLPGPSGATAFPPPEGFKLEPGLVRDVAVLGRTLFCAADAAGLASLSLDEPWLPGMSVTVSPLTVAGEPAYAVRVEAAHGRLAVGIGRAPIRLLEGAPYHPTGIVGTNLSVGGVARALAPTGASEALLVFDTNGGRVTKTLHELPESGWLSLALGRERVYEQHLGIGFQIRALDAAGTVLFQRRPEGIPAIDGVTALRDPGLVLFGTDFAGSTLAGIPRIQPDGSTLVLPVDFDTLGLTAGAQWLDEDDENAEWLVAGAPFSWNLWRVESGAQPRLTRWELLPPRDADGTTGYTYFHSAIDGDLLFLTRHGSSTGALCYSASALAELARGEPAGTQLEPPPLFQLETHTGGKRRSTWRASFATLEDGRRIAAVAAGLDGDPESPTFRQSRLVLFDVSAGTASAPTFLAAAHGPEAGHSISVELARHGERTLAFVADLASGLLVFDVTTPENPFVTGRWPAPVSSYDGLAANVLDVELARVDGRRVAYLAAGRVGLVCVDVTAPDSFALPTLATLDTPGLASGLTKTRLGDRRLLVVGDQRAGLRVYTIPGMR